MSKENYQRIPEQESFVGKIIRACLENKLVVALFVLGIILAGVYVAPFDWNLGNFPRNPVPTDAIPDIGENQQIVFTKWPGRSPQDVEDQITYPLTVSLLGVPGVKTIRSQSMFGFSSIYVIFEEDVEFYWSRSRIIEKLNSLPSGTIPEGVQPALGPDATALGQIYWYTLEGRDPEGNPAGGWDLEELRTIQDWYVRYSLLSAEGVSEVASVGGFVREYQVDVDPDAMRAYDVTLPQVYSAVKGSNIDVGAKTIELNRVEYFIRGIGFIENISDLENSVITVNKNVPVKIKDVANVTLGPALRRGALDKSGAEAVGGVVVARYGQNPLSAINNVKGKISELSTGLPTKPVIDYKKTSPEKLRKFAEKQGFDAYIGSELNEKKWLEYSRNVSRNNWPDWFKTSKVTVVPFYDRTELIYETLGTLNTALILEILVTFIVVIVMVMHFRSSFLIGTMLPLAVLLCFIAMKYFGVAANIVALSGIAIAIGTIVDMGIVISENILNHLQKSPKNVSRLEVIHRASSEVGTAVLTAVATTVVSFLPVFTMIGSEGKLFKPLAFTKTFAIIASIIIALTVLPPASLILLTGKFGAEKLKKIFFLIFALAAAVISAYGIYMSSGIVLIAGLILVLFAIYNLLKDRLPSRFKDWIPYLGNMFAVLFIGLLLTKYWEPLGPELGMLKNFIFIAMLIGIIMLILFLFQYFYTSILSWCLRHKAVFLSFVAVLVFFGFTVWLGVETTLGFVPAGAEKLGLKDKLAASDVWTKAKEELPGLGKEFMPPLDEGSFLYMPTTMAHASIGEAMDVMKKQDMAFQAIPEIESAVGKLGRAETPLDPAPISMIETIITYKSEYKTDKSGNRLTFKYDKENEKFIRDPNGNLIEDPDGIPFRQWRDKIKTPDDIWDEIVKAAEIPGTTSAPKLQPISARIVMLQSGMRAPLGIKVKGPSLETIENTGLQIEKYLKQVPSVKPDTVIADRIIGKPYLEIIPDRKKLSRYGIKIRDFQDIIEVAIGGKKVTTTVESRERFPVRVRYMRELRDRIETIKEILVPAKDGTQIPLRQVADIEYVRGPQVIKSEDTFLTGYVLFDKKDGYAEVDVVEQAKRYLEDRIDQGDISIPSGVSFTFAGSYKNQLRAQKTLSIVLPLALFIIFMILYFQFHSVLTTLLIFTGIFVAWTGGFILIWLYGQDWFMNFSVFGTNMRTLFQIQPINLSVAVWVGFLALFGIATDNGVVLCTYLKQIFRNRETESKQQIREATLIGAKRRVRPCLITTATTILALIPVLTSTGRGSDIMVPMAIPSFGGMLIQIITILTVPVLYSLIKENSCPRQE